MTVWGPRERLKFSQGGSRSFLRESTHGAKLVENVVQALARDILADGLLRTHRAGYIILRHVHDEILCDEPENGKTAGDLEELMGMPATWATGLSLAASGFRSTFYRKE